MKKRLAIFGVIAALLMLAACSAAAPEYGTEQTQEQEQIVLHLFHYQGEAEEAYGHVIAAYEKAHPNVKIKSEFLNSENYNSTLDARIAVQDCPDLIGVHPGYAQALPLARADSRVLKMCGSQTRRPAALRAASMPRRPI